MLIATFPSVRALPVDARALLEQADSLFDSMAWWQVVEAHAMPSDAEPFFVTVQSAGRTVAVVPAMRTGRRIRGMTTPYTCAFRPLIVADLDRTARIAAMSALARFDRNAAMMGFDALPAEWNGLADLQTGARLAGLVPLRFDHFGNWYENVDGLNWSAYLRQRPGALRETIRRRLGRAEKSPDAHFHLFTGSERINQAVEVFESVYQRSWKKPEPFPSFNIALMHATARLGLLRLGCLSIGPTTVAVQFWIVQSGHATVLKLAHDETFKAQSPGTVLTAMMLRHLLENEGVTQIDFGRGDDPYKRGWAAQRRQRIGLLLVNPRHPAGLFALLRHGLGRLRDRSKRGPEPSGNQNDVDI